jgi:hypothetical protein
MAEEVKSLSTCHCGKTIYNLGTEPKFECGACKQKYQDDQQKFNTFLKWYVVCMTGIFIFILSKCLYEMVKGLK